LTSVAPERERRHRQEGDPQHECDQQPCLHLA
jgi:hypothetical protein